MKMNKKAQAAQMTASSMFVVEFMLSALLIFGVIQALVFVWPGGGLALREFIDTYFMGSNAFFLFMGAGALGMAFNQLTERFEAGIAPLFNSRIGAFIVFGIAALAIGFLIKTGNIFPTTASMLLP